MNQGTAHTVDTVTTSNGWKMVVRHYDGYTVAEVWCLGVKLSETRLNEDGNTTVTAI